MRLNRTVPNRSKRRVRKQHDTTGNYTVKQQLTLNITAVQNPIKLGRNITITGTLTPSDNRSMVEVQFLSANSSETVDSHVSSNGTFTAIFNLKLQEFGLSPQVPLKPRLLGEQTAGNWR